LAVRQGILCTHSAHHGTCPTVIQPTEPTWTPLSPPEPRISFLQFELYSSGAHWCPCWKPPSPRLAYLVAPHMGHSLGPVGLVIMAAGQSRGASSEIKRETAHKTHLSFSTFLSV
jgi:hypothetical protein